MAQDALPYAEQALTLAERIESKELQAKALGNIGTVLQNLSDYARALEYYTKALTAYEELGEKSNAASVTGNIGSVYSTLSDYPRALEYYAKALAVHEELGNKSSIAAVVGNIGLVYMGLSDYPLAMEYLKRALTLDEELGNKVSIANDISNIGAVHHNLMDYDMALEYFSRALALFEELGNRHGIAVNTGNIGSVYYNLSDYSKAMEYYTRTIALFEEVGDSQGAAINTGNIGLVYSKVDFDGYNVVKAEEYLVKALLIVEELKLKKIQYELHRLLAEFYEKQGRWKEAYKHKTKFYELKDEAQSEEAKKQADKLEYERKNAEREKQLALAQKEKAILNNILPEEITTRLIKGENPIADTFDCVSILFMDIVDFTNLSTTISARQLVHLLNAIFTAADGVIREFGLEKIKTIGDAYMAVAGAPIVQEDHAERAAQAALKLLEVMQNLMVDFPENYGDRSWIESIPEIEVRIGLHCGPAAAGVVGENKFLYDLWGDAVNTASRMESHGEAGKIHVSEEFVNALSLNRPSDTFSHWEKEGMRAIPRGEMEIKGKGTMKTYFLEKYL